MKAAIHYVWCRFVAFLMLKAFNVTPEEVNDLRRARLENDRLRIAFVRAKLTIEELGEEAATWRVTAEKCAEAAANLRPRHDTRTKLLEALEAVRSSRTHNRAIVIAGEAIRSARHDADTLPDMLAATAGMVPREG